jgi:phospholipase/carboxylesterase
VTHPPPIEIEPARPARAAVIALHGLGADGADLAPLATETRLDPELRVRWILPTAAERALAIAGGELQRAWFDVGPDDLRRGEASDLSGLRAAEALVRGLVDRERARGIPAARIVLGGFSQGGALACFTAVRSAQPMGGLFALSTYLAGNVRLEADAAPGSRGLPVFAAHGALDALVPIARGRALRERLARLSCEVEGHEYAMGHELCAEEIAELGAWLARVLR